MKSYEDLREALVHAAVRYELARRAHEESLAECIRVRRASLAIRPSERRELESALHVAGQRRDALNEAERAYKAKATEITADLEQRSGATITNVFSDG